MFNKEREQEIINIMNSSGGFVTVKNLCERLFASESSIRRDLKALEKRGVIKRSYGGARLINSFSDITAFSNRIHKNSAAKKIIAKKAAAQVGEGSVVFLDQSSTAFYLACELMRKNSLTVVTNNIEILMLLSGTNIKAVASGGYLSNENRNCLIGEDARQTFENIYADIMFFSTKSVSDDGIITDCSREEVTVRNAMLENSAKKVFLCDATKFHSRSHYKQCTVKNIDCTVCDSDEAESLLKYNNSLEIL